MKALGAVLLAGLLGSADEETTAITHLRILTVSHGDIPLGTILIRGSRIAAVGPEVEPPAGSRIIDGTGRVAFPGMIHPCSRLGTVETAGGGSSVSPLHLAIDELNPAHDALAQAARSGLTALVVLPGGSGIPGQGAVVKPVGWTREEQLVEPGALLRIVLETGTAAKDAYRQALEGARKAMEGEKKTPPVKPDEKSAVLSRFLRGELPAWVEVPSASGLLHFWQIQDALGESKAKVVLSGPPDVYKAVAELGRRKARVIVRPLITLAPFTRERINVAAELVRAGAEVALAPVADTPEALEGLRFRAAELVKYGLPRTAAERGLTLAPAQFAGVDKRLGSIDAGKDADFLLFDGDPLSPESRLCEVYINGKPVAHGH